MATPAYFAEGQQYSDDDILAAIAQKESGGSEDPWNVTNQYGMRGPWQFSPDTYAEVAKQNGLDGSDWSPENQTAVARAHIHDLRSKYGDIGAIQAWLGGEGNVGNGDFTDGNGVSINQYTQDVLNNLQNFTGQDPSSIYGKNSGPYQTNLLEGYRRAGGILNNPNEPFPSDFVQRMMAQPTVNASQRVMNDFLQNQAPEITARAMGAYNRNKDFFNAVNKMSADAAREGAGIENKNMQKTMAAQFADQIAQSNSSANIALLAKLGAALTGVQFDPNSKQLADAGQLYMKQIEINNQATKANINQANKDREYALEAMKTKAYLDRMNNAGSYSGGGTKAGGSAGAAGGQPVAYALESEDEVKNSVNKLLEDPMFKQNLNIIQTGASTPEQRNTATYNIAQMTQNYMKTLFNNGKRGSFMEIANNVLPSILSQNEEMSHPAGTNPADQAAQQQVVQDQLARYFDTVIGYDANKNPITMRNYYDGLNGATAQASGGTLVNP